LTAPGGYLLPDTPFFLPAAQEFHAVGGAQYMPTPR
jgi:hypothetical protein